VSAAEQHELPGSKGTANFMLKFDKGSKSTASVGVGVGEAACDNMAVCVELAVWALACVCSCV